MPIFEYKCGKCGNSFEKLIRTSSEKIECPECGNGKVEKMLSVFSASVAGSPKCEMKPSCPSAGTKCCSGGTCGLHR